LPRRISLRQPFPIPSPTIHVNDRESEVAHPGSASFAGYIVEVDTVTLEPDN